MCQGWRAKRSVSSSSGEPRRQNNKRKRQPASHHKADIDLRTAGCRSREGHETVCVCVRTHTSASLDSPTSPLASSTVIAAADGICALCFSGFRLSAVRLFSAVASLLTLLLPTSSRSSCSSVGCSCSSCSSCSSFAAAAAASAAASFLRCSTKMSSSKCHLRSTRKPLVAPPTNSTQPQPIPPQS